MEMPQNNPNFSDESNLSDPSSPGYDPRKDPNFILLAKGDNIYLEKLATLKDAQIGWGKALMTEREIVTPEHPAWQAVTNAQDELVQFEIENGYVIDEAPPSQT